MENASKALIIAGAILLSILIISLGILIFSQAQDTIDSINMSEQEIMAFNNKFTPYEGTRVRGSQVNALIQAVLSNNQSALDNGEQTTKGINLTATDSRVNPAISISIQGTTGANQTVQKVPAGSFYKVEFTYEKSLVRTIKITAAT